MTIDFNALASRLNDAKKTLVRNEKPVTPKQGETKIILMQGWRPNDPETFWREYGAHFIKDGNSNTAFYPCDEIIHGTECPVCKCLGEVARSAQDQSVLDWVKSGRANRQFLVNAIIIGENNNEPVVMGLSKTAFEQLINVISSWGQTVFDLQNPQALVITRTGTGFDTKYMVQVSPERFQMPPTAMQKMKNLDEYVDQRSEALLNKALGAINGNSVLIANHTEPVAHPQVGYTQPMQQMAPAMQQAPMQPMQAMPPQGQPQMGSTMQPMQPQYGQMAPQPVTDVQPVVHGGYVPQSMAPQAQPMQQMAPQPQVAQPMAPTYMQPQQQFAPEQAQAPWEASAPAMQQAPAQQMAPQGQQAQGATIPLDSEASDLMARLDLLG